MTSSPNRPTGSPHPRFLPCVSALSFLALPCLSLLVPSSPAVAQANDGRLVHAEPGGFRTVLREQRKGETVLVFPASGGAKRVRVRDGRVLDAFEGSCSGSAFAGSYVVGLTENCVLDEASGRIESLGATPAFDNAFHVAWLGEDATATRFLMNGRPWTSDGYMVLRTIEKATGRVDASTLVTGVPGYSGAMAIERGRDKFHFTMGTGEFSNVLFTADLAGLRAAAAAGVPFGFATRFLETARFEGLSFDMDAASGTLVYHTEESYLYDLDRGVRKEHGLRAGCEPFALAEGGSLLAKCDGKEVRAFPALK